MESQETMKPETPSLDPISYFQAALAKIAAVHERKASDYTTFDEFENFEYAAEVAGINTAEAIEVLIGVKTARLKTLKYRDPLNESKFDTYLDRAVYSIIALAHQMKLANDVDD
jgi:hypothetical protein